MADNNLTNFFSSMMGRKQEEPQAPQPAAPEVLERIATASEQTSQAASRIENHVAEAMAAFRAAGGAAGETPSAGWSAPVTQVTGEGGFAVTVGNRTVNVSASQVAGAGIGTVQQLLDYVSRDTATSSDKITNVSINQGTYQKTDRLPSAPLSGQPVRVIATMQAGRLG